jgi:sterol desaturase/sphingolipid hydroxylase (fatty acid hydroxylase superfamily)
VGNAADVDWLRNPSSTWLATAAFAAFFAALAIVTKRKRAFSDVRRGWAEWRTNLLFFIVDTLLILPYVGLPSVWIARHVGHVESVAAFLASVPLWLACALAVVAGDYVGYWRHRIEHSRVLWPAHAVHHSDQELSWFSLNRMHPINRFSTVTIDGTVLALLGFPVTAVIANAFVRNAWGYFVHADLRWTLGPLGKVLVSPSAHRWHHGRQTANRNFSTVFVWWDQLHRTYHASTRPFSEPTGIDGRPRGFLFEMASPAISLVSWVRGVHPTRNGTGDDLLALRGMGAERD